MSATQKNISTPGLLLKRNPRGEYDEKLTFFTKNYGKIELLSFGSRSAKSKRRALLASGNFLQLEIKQRDHHLNLEATTLDRYIPFQEYYKTYPIYIAWLANMGNALPFKAADPSLYTLIETLCSQQVLKSPLRFLSFYLNAALLQQTGLFHSATACQICGKSCSESYVFTLAKEIIGKECFAPLLKSGQAAMTERSSFTKKKPPPKNTMLSHHFIGVLWLSHMGIAYLNFFAKQKKLVLEQHRMIHQKEFVEKAREAEWQTLIQFTQHLLTIN